MNEFIIDWVSIRFSPDFHSKKIHYITLEEFLEVFGITDFFSNFEDIGPCRYYSHCYRYHGFALYVSELAFLSVEEIIHSPHSTEAFKEYSTLGICLEMSGQACRKFENIKSSFTWKDFFTTIFIMNENGCSVNIPRLDIAKDDKENLLNIDTIVNCAHTGEYVSLYRTSGVKQKKFDISIDENSKNRLNTFAKTVYFGNRKSNCFCRIYDKKLEQLQKNSNNPNVVSELKKLISWTRFEIVFKNNNAIKVVNALIRLSDSDFAFFLAQTINSYIRFAKIDNQKSNRRTVFKWWIDFIGSVKTACLSCRGFVKNPVNAAIDWVKQSVSVTAHALIKQMGINAFIDLIIDSGSEKRFKPKHYEIANGFYDSKQEPFSSSEKWSLLCPIGVV